MSCTTAKTSATGPEPREESFPPSSLSPSPLPGPPYPSIYDIAHQHPRERLLVKPPLWTDRHLELLHCTFSQPPEILKDYPMEYILTETPVEKKYTAYCVRELRVSWSSHGPHLGFKRLLAAQKCPLDAPVTPYCFMQNPRYPLYFRFGGRRPVKLECLPLYLREDDTSLRTLRDRSRPWPLPVVACVSGRLISDARWDALRPPERGNPQYLEQCRRAQRKISPQDPWRDPYVFALLIAQAQAKRAAAEREKRVRNDQEPGAAAASRPALTADDVKHSSPSYVLSTFDNDPDYIHHFIADIPTTFLDMLGRPSDPRQAPTSVHIQHSRIPINPEKSLRERLLQRLLPQATEQARRRKRGADGPPDQND